jgi:hypothetical protein
MFLEILATLAAGLFAGAAIYIDLAEQPAREQIDTAAALDGVAAPATRGPPWCSRCWRRSDS